MLPRLIAALLLVVLVSVHASWADAEAGDVYRQAVALAAQGRDAEAVAMLAGAAELAPAVWNERMRVAAQLLAMRARQGVELPSADGLNGALIVDYDNTHAAPQPADARFTAILAGIFPGAGHAWLGRWHDAGIAALMVWPMLLLTLWSWRRHMGPLTVFFALITLWLWSGSVFSAVSLAERGAFEAYMLWWQGLWQASGLPSRPW